MQDIWAEKHEAPSDLDDVDPDKEMDDIQWLKAKYVKVLDRERKLNDYLIKKMADFDLRIRALEVEG